MQGRIQGGGANTPLLKLSKRTKKEEEKQGGKGKKIKVEKREKITNVKSIP